MSPGADDGWTPGIAGTRRLLGRRREQDTLNHLLQGARDGAGGVLVLHGQPGVGKTVLLEDAIASASGFRTVSAVGVEGEMELPFAALHQLCAPILGYAQNLPDLQREALDVAFALRAGPAPDPFLIGLATLGLLSEAAEAQPLLCVVDDAQWLDSASAKALTFAARRVLAEKIAVLFAAREADRALAALPTLRLGPLGHRDALDLMRSVLPGPIDERVLERLVSETHGNPLAVVEFPRGLTLPQLAGGFALPAALSLTVQIEESFTRRLDDLSQPARRLLLLASADPSGDPALLTAAARLMGIPEDTREQLEAQELLEVAAAVTFRHPLVRSAVYGSATPEDRREVHRALAEAIDPRLDPDRHAWHRAQAAAAPDEEVAEELERSAVRAQSRGGLAASAAFLERAAALSVDPARRTERALAAAKAKRDAGSLREALELLAGVDRQGADERQRAVLALVEAQVILAARRGAEAAPMLLAAAAAFEAADPRVARDAYLEAMNGTLFSGGLAGKPSLAEVGRAALGAPPPAESTATDLLLEGIALWFTDSYAAAAPALKAALRAFTDGSSSRPVTGVQLWMATWAAAELWEEETWILLSEEQLRRARATGELTAIPPALGNRSIILAMAGELAAVASLVDEQETIAGAAGLAPTYNGALWLPAWAGNETELAELGRAASNDAIARGEGYALELLGLVGAVLYNGLGRHAQAVAAVRSSPEKARDLGAPIAAVVELVEAASRSGERALAEVALEHVLERAEVAQSTWARATAARSRALLAAPGEDDDLYREAIEHFSATRLRVDLARTHLLYGESLCRSGRRDEGREQLRSARELFATLGTAAFAERARRELQAAGDRTAPRQADEAGARAELTPQELRIAGLAAEGHTNREIAAQLFISPSTVEYHLGKSFRKLGVKSRTQLAHELEAGPPATLP